MINSNLQHARYVVSRTENVNHDVEVAAIIAKAVSAGMSVDAETLNTNGWLFTEINVTNPNIFD